MKIKKFLIGIALVFILVNIVPAVSSVSLEKGDIVFVDITLLARLGGGIARAGTSNDHVAIYAGNGYFWESAPYTEALVNLGFPGIWCGVQLTHKSVHKMLYKNYQVAKYQGTITSIQRNLIYIFCLLQNGEDYQWSYPNHSPYDSCFSNPDVDSFPPLPIGFYNKYDDALDEMNGINIKDRWTCAELAWAAWLHAVHVDIDSYPYKEYGWEGTYADESDIYSYINYIDPMREYINNNPDEFQFYDIPKWRI